MTVDDAMNMVRLQDVLMSPDGKWVSGKTPVRYVKFPREPHGFREPRHQRRRDIEEIKWMQKYVMGIEWKPWERKTEIKK